VLPAVMVVCPKATFLSEWLPVNRRNWSPFIPALTRPTKSELNPAKKQRWAFWRVSSLGLDALRSSAASL
jgi:hypothetical protein